jgi:8-oxo-dGTP pyrophosphatase MutT (NUDIX family)
MVCVCVACCRVCIVADEEIRRRDKRHYYQTLTNTSKRSSGIMDALLFSASALASLYFLKQKEDSGSRRIIISHPTTDNEQSLLNALQQGTSLNAHERICLVTPDNQIIEGGGVRKDMRLYNQWHRATYILIIHLQPEGKRQRNLDEQFVLVQRRSRIKDYCPSKLDPTPGGVVGYQESYEENAVREVAEEMGFRPQSPLLKRFTFPYEDEKVRVWGEFYECEYRGAFKDLKIQESEVESLERMSLQELKDRLETNPDDFMPDACHAMRLYFRL